MLPPEIQYDTAVPAVTIDPPPPVTVVPIPEPLPLPGQLQPIPETKAPPQAASPATRVDRANAAARVQPARDGFLNAIQVYPYSAGALYQVYAAPGQVTDIALQEGEHLVGSGPVAAGDTVRWIIGDTESGTGAAKKIHILVKPTRPDIKTNLVINTDRRTYHLELRATAKTYLASVSWAYPEDQLIALRRQNQEAEAHQPIASGIDITALNFRYAIDGDSVPWRPLRAFDDGMKVGRILLIPQGARLIGQYDSSVAFGQSRVLLVWTRLILPNGKSIVLERQPGADTQGYAGLEDDVDYHWGTLFKGALLSTLLNVGAEAGSSSQDDAITRALRQGASNSVSQTGQQIVQRQLNIQPTLTIRPGFPVRVIATRDLVLEPYGD